MLIEVAHALVGKRLHSESGGLRAAGKHLVEPFFNRNIGLIAFDHV